METLRPISILLVLLTLALAPSPAQNLRDSRGTDFWLTFMPNDRNLSDSDPSLHIFITSQYATTGTISAVRRNGSTYTVPFVIAQPNDTYSLRLNPDDHELRGGVYKNGNVTTGDAEIPSKIAVHITGNAELSVYAATREQFTTDAWLLLPTDALGTEYRVLSYASYAFFERDNPTRVDQGFPGQFVVIATADDTRVDIELTPGKSSVRDEPRRTITLQRGEVYLVQAAISNTNRNDDLTGSRVRANKPIVVSGGHFRAQVPIAVSAEPSRDFLVEQVPSVDTWGKRCVVVPPKAPSNETNYGPWDHSVCRILSANPNTIVNANGTMYTLADGGFVDLPLTEVIVVDATYPVLCAIVARSARRGTLQLFEGDPFLMVVPPPEQFQNSYTIINIEPRPSRPYFDAHWLTLIVPLAAEQSLILDGVQPGALTPIPGTTLGYLHVSVSANAHSTSCDSAFGIYIYGYGPAESYGYSGGMSFQQLFTPTVVLRVHNMQAAPGKLDTMIVTIDSISDMASFVAYGANRINFDVSWNASMFVPRNSGGVRLSGVNATASKSFTFDSLRAGDTLMSVAGYHALGTNDADSIVLTNNLWYSANDDTVTIITIVQNGLLTTNGICLEGGERLFDPHGKSVQQLSQYSIVYDEQGNAFLACSRSYASASARQRNDNLEHNDHVDIFDARGRLVHRLVVPANCTAPLPLDSAPYEPLFVRP